MSTLTSAGILLAILLAALAAAAAAFAGYALGLKHTRKTSLARRFHDPALTNAHREQLVGRLQDLETITVNDIMIPRSEIAWIDLDDDWDTILDQLRTTPHTRLPICRDDIDHVVGILHMKKVAHALVRGDFDREALSALAHEREAYFVPEATALNVQLLNFQRDRRRIALVVDEYGDLQGLVTLEDILEEIVGDFTSAPATLHQDTHRDADGSYVVNGAVNVRVLNRTLGWNLPTNGPRTLNGLIVEYLETIPEPGTTLMLGDLFLEILQTSDNSVKTVRIRAGEIGDAAGASSSAPNTGQNGVATSVRTLDKAADAAHRQRARR